MKFISKLSFLCFLLINLLQGHIINGQNINHPLDPLSWQEYWKVLNILQESNHLNENTNFSHINLIPPDKSLVWDWKPGIEIPRAAFAIVHQGSKTFKAEVDLKNEKLDKFEELEGIQPTWLGREYVEMTDKVKAHPDFIAAMKNRGYEDLTFFDMVFLPAGYYGTQEQLGRRIGLGNVFAVEGVRNIWSREIAGLTAVVDLNSKEVLRIVDEGVVKVPTENIDFNQSSITELRKIPGRMEITQPNGPGFTIDGHVVEWQKWKFHIRPDQRVGMIISTVSYQDGSEKRKIMYEGYMSEMFVPYMDPAFQWYHRNFMDAGEISFGGLAKPLLKGLDAPEYAHYMDGLVIKDNGRPSPVSNMIAIFERETGDPSWRHYSMSMESESRVKRDLVIRSAAVAGNYDYIFDWIFQQDGSIKVLVGATGIAQVKASMQKDATSNPGNDEPGDAYGRFVDPNIVAVNHDHYFSYRIDLDVDGKNNSLNIDRLRTVMLPDEHPRRSVWVSKPLIAKTESEAKLKINLDKPALWRVISDGRKNHVGYPTSYQLMPGKTANTLLSTDDYPRRRAGFIDYHLWVTPHNKHERFAVGDFPTLSLPGKGLPEWTKANRSIENKDIVLWYTVGMHHMVRSEDWPVMPVMWQSFELRPFDFFNENPALDLPKN